MSNYILILAILAVVLPLTFSRHHHHHLNIQAFKKCVEDSGLSADTIAEPSNGTAYDEANHQWNFRLPPANPPAIFFPSTGEDIEVAVKCGVKHHVPLIPKSGGHSSESISSANPHTVLMDLQRMDHIDINAEDKTVVIQPGNVLGRVYYTLYNNGGFGLPLGTCFTVGVSGFTLGGGIGFFSGLYGLGPDNVIEMTMVDATGKTNVVSKTENPDLYWGLRGMGSGYIGIVSSFKFKMFDANALKLTFIQGSYPLSEAAQVLHGFSELLVWTREHAPNSVTFISIEGGELSLDYLFPLETPTDKTDADWLAKVKELMPESDKLTVMNPPFLDFLKMIGHADLVGPRAATYDDLPTIHNNMILPVFQKIRSFNVDKAPTLEDWEKVSAILQRMPKENMELTLLSQNGGVRNHLTYENAYVHRRPLFYFSSEYTNREDNKDEHAAALAWQEDFIEGTKFIDNGKTYQNDVDLDMPDQFERYYGDNLDELIKIKTKWDPKNYFKNAASLPVYE